MFNSCNTGIAERLEYPAKYDKEQFQKHFRRYATVAENLLQDSAIEFANGSSFMFLLLVQNHRICFGWIGFTIV